MAVNSKDTVHLRAGGFSRVGQRRLVTEPEVTDRYFDYHK